MKKLTILQDMDSITVDLMGPWCASFNRKFKKKGDAKLTVEKITNWDMHTLVPETFAIYKIIERRGFFRKLPALPGAIESTQKLLDAGHEVFLLSAASGEALTDKSKWVMKYMPFMKNRMFLSHAKTPKDGIHGDVLIDDGPHNILGFRKANPNAFIATIEYPYLTPEAKAAASFTVPYTDPQVWPKIMAAIQAYAEAR
jgi:5'(3')-deoxyribonucleotidase